MAAKKPQPMKLEHVLVQSGARRNYDALEREGRRDERLFSALKDELFANAAANIKHKDVQRAKAQKPRGAGDDGRTTKQVVADVVKGHPIDTKADDLLPHVHAALDENGKESITDKWAKQLIREARAARKRV